MTEVGRRKGQCEACIQDSPFFFLKKKGSHHPFLGIKNGNRFLVSILGLGPFHNTVVLNEGKYPSLKDRLARAPVTAHSRANSAVRFRVATENCPVDSGMALAFCQNVFHRFIYCFNLMQNLNVAFSELCFNSDVRKM